MTEDTQQPTEAADVKPEAAVPQLEQPATEVTPVEKPKPKRYVKKKAAPPAPTPVLTLEVADQRIEPVAPPEPEPPAPSVAPPTVETPVPKTKAKAKPRAKKAVAKDVVIDTVDAQPITQETQEPTVVTEP